MSRLEQIREQLDVVRAQLGDDEAFMRLAEHYHALLLHYVRRIVQRKPRPRLTVSGGPSGRRI